MTAAGIDPVHFGLIVTLNLAIGQQTPPVASVLLLTCSIAKESVWDVTRGNIPFIARAARRAAADHLRARRRRWALVDLFYRDDAANHPASPATARSPPSTLTSPERLNALTRRCGSSWATHARSSRQDDVAALHRDARRRRRRLSPPARTSRTSATSAPTSKQARQYGERIAGTMQAFAACRHPVVALIQGACVGGGLAIAALRDIRICGESSRFGVPVNKLGLVDGLRRAAGHDARSSGAAATLEILLEGRVFERARGLREGPRQPRRARRPGRSTKPTPPRGASPTARRSSRAGTRSSCGAWPIRGR